MNCKPLASQPRGGRLYNYRVRFGREWLVLGLLMALVVSLTAGPYLYAAWLGGEQAIFGGFLLNPVDGATYLAKMHQGWEGSWRARLAFTAEPGEGAFFFPFYLALGHLARLFGISLVVMFHLARLVASLLMLWSLYKYFKAHLVIPERTWPAFILAVFGSGLGWLAVPAGGFTADFWVAEAYPFLAAYANPHFPLGIALTLWCLTPPRADQNGVWGGGAALVTLAVGLALAFLLPFGLLIALGVLAFLALGDLYRRQPVGWHVHRFIWLACAAAPVMLYDLWVVHNDPVFAAWNRQNLTPTPPPLDLLLAFSPALLLALGGAWLALQERPARLALFLAWVATTLGVVYLPLNLQRRMLTGFYIPLAGLAVYTLERLAPQRMRLVFLLVLVVSLPTNLLVLLAARHGALTRDPQLYLSVGEWRAFEWLQENTSPAALVLASPESGLWIPAYSGRRVLYGHPFETADAAGERATVSAFFEGSMKPAQRQALLASRGVDYVFWGPRERTLARIAPDESWEAVYEEGGVTIYAVPVPGE